MLLVHLPAALLMIAPHRVLVRPRDAELAAFGERTQKLLTSLEDWWGTLDRSACAA
jgi:hypothetical protein